MDDNHNKARDGQGMEATETERVFHNLCVIAAISQNDKLMTNEEDFQIYTPTSIRGAVRTWYGETRTRNVRRIGSTLTSAKESIRLAMENTEELLRRPVNGVPSGAKRIRLDTDVARTIRMAETIRRSVEGVQNMACTYRDDAGLNSQLNSLVLDTQDFIGIVVESLREHVLQCSNNTRKDLTRRLNALVPAARTNAPGVDEILPACAGYLPSVVSPTDSPVSPSSPCASRLGSPARD